jgi:hypothetical protein
MDFQDDAAEFSVEDVDTIVKNAIAGCLTDVTYNAKKVNTPRSQLNSFAFRCLIAAVVAPVKCLAM